MKNYCTILLIILAIFACKQDKGEVISPSERLKFEAENGVRQGTLSVSTMVGGFSGAGYVASFSSTNDKLIFSLVNELAGDYIRIEPFSPGVAVSNLVTPNPSPEAVNLYNYLKQSYGKKIHSGATAITSSLDEENWIFLQTGKYPALAGFDFMNHTRNYSWEKREI